MQQTARAGAEGPERVPGDEEDQLPALLLPVRRRAAGDPLADQGPAGRAAAPAPRLNVPGRTVAGCLEPIVAGLLLHGGRRVLPYRIWQRAAGGVHCLGEPLNLQRMGSRAG